MELRKAKLLNVIVSSITAFLIIFMIINLVEKNYVLAISDVILFLFVSVPSWILQYKKKYKANTILITSAFLFYTTLITILQYDVNRQTEHILPAISIMVIFLFDGWKKNLIFLLFPISFFTIRFVIMYSDLGYIDLKSLHLMYLLEFLTVYVIASYFKADMMNFYRKLQLANQTKDKLFRIISHDLKNPFSSLLGISELQLKFVERNDFDKIKSSAEIIHGSATKIYDLTQSLLDWSLSQSETINIDIQKVNITSIIAQVCDFCEITARPKDIRIRFIPKQELQWQCDSIMTQIAVRNIIMNAIKFSPRNSEIIVSQEIVDNNLQIIVQDFGVGIERDIIPNIFSENSIYSSYGTEKEKGTGLGLKISKELIEKQSGQIILSSELGKGSEFTIILP
ncbi:MAG: HAMP domain-containing histidine kinase [Bacteroidales bacterium]|nr:HAMP domain-containing histidine kinase [Bacteroidales bacterium]